MGLLSTFFLLATLSGFAFSSIGPIAHLSIANKVISPDGYTRAAVLAGGSFPGPLIKGRKGSEFSINVTDALTDTSMDLSTSIHWHGIFQQHTNYVDGVSFVTQCPIVPKESFVYKFTPVNQAGTYWYHSHFKNQYCDGLRGPLVIYDPNDPHRQLYDIDNDRSVITLSDWYHYVSTVAPTINVANSTLINGKGRYSGGPTNVSLAEVYVHHGKRHELTVIEVDGQNVQPLLVDSLQIFAGQRYSVILHANQSIGNYWIRALPNISGANYTNLTNLAILHYDRAPNQNPLTDPTTDIPTSVLALNETDLHPLVPQSVPGEPVAGGADININLNVSLVAPLNLHQTDRAHRNSIPRTTADLSGAKKASDLLPSGSIYGLAPNKSVEITIPAGAAGGPHPVHLHGHAFHVVRSAGNSTYNFDNPVIRDVVSIGNASTNDNVTIRFFTDNPGPWFLHCHIDWHLNELAITLNSDWMRFRADESMVPPEVSQWCSLKMSLTSRPRILRRMPGRIFAQLTTPSLTRRGTPDHSLHRVWNPLKLLPFTFPLAHGYLHFSDYHT
ncbi:laccase [Multifurca ochricompacta]|uniref:Laccase n=1 Tax=Multifurca ochricompacta TaxID=376703 RepID=A0AAD4M302_9AGAM|nr:laccase [Multifurca ochricompacta]